MSQPVLEPITSPATRASTGGPQRRHPEPGLVLSKLQPESLVDQLDDDAEPIELITFGTVRECCPACQTIHLRLVLRQRRVRVAHLFCAQCQGCFDAHYTNGDSALTI